MKKNQKGFTLVELLGVIVIVSLISLMVVPKIMERFNKQQIEASQSAENLLYAATREYIATNDNIFSNNSDYYCVSIGDLINSGNLVEPVIDIETGSTISKSMSIDVSVENGQYRFNYNTSRCIAGFLQLIPSVDKTSLTIRIKLNTHEDILASLPFSFDNGITWQVSNEYVISSHYDNIIKIKDRDNNVQSIPLNISKLTINANGGVWNSLSENSIFWLKKDETMYLENPIKLQYSFEGWTKSLETDSTINNKVFKMGDQDITINANWIFAEFELTIDPNGGQWEGQTSQLLYSGNTARIENPTKENCIFVGWEISEESSSINNEVFTMGMNDTNIIARWRFFGQSDYIYTGNSTLEVDENGNWNLKLLSSGTLTFYKNTPIDLFLVGGGGSGGPSYTKTHSGSFGRHSDSWGYYYGSYNNRYDGGGGGGGYTKTISNSSLIASASYEVTIGLGGNLTGDINGGTTEIVGIDNATAAGGKGATYEKGGNGGSGGGVSAYRLQWTTQPCTENKRACLSNSDTYKSSTAGASDGGSMSGQGQGTTTKEFGEENGILYSGGGGGGGDNSTKGSNAAGGLGGGGAGHVAGTPNTGGGGGAHEEGGSGIVIIRNAR